MSLTRSVTVTLYNDLPYDLQLEDSNCANAPLNGTEPPQTIKAGANSSWEHVGTILGNLSGWARYGFTDNNNSHVSGTLSWANPVSGGNSYDTSSTDSHNYPLVMTDDPNGRGTDAKKTFRFEHYTFSEWPGTQMGYMLHRGSGKYLVAMGTDPTAIGLMLLGSQPTPGNKLLLNPPLYTLTDAGALYHYDAKKYIVGAAEFPPPSGTRLVLSATQRASNGPLYYFEQTAEGNLQLYGTKLYVVPMGLASDDLTPMILSDCYSSDDRYTFTT